MASETRRHDSEREALAEYAASAGEPRAAAANLPVDLNEPGVVWLIDRGALDISVAEHAGGRIGSAFKHLLRLGPGRLAFGMDQEAADAGMKLAAKGLSDARLYRIPIGPLLEEIARGAGGTDLASALVVEVDAWIEDFAAAVARGMEPRPAPVLNIEPGLGPEALTTGILTTRHGVVWIRGEAPDAAFLEMEDARADGPGLMPVTRQAWIMLRRTEGIACIASGSLRIDTLLRRGLPEFHRLALGAEAANRRLLLVDDANLQAAHGLQRRRDESDARRSLTDLSDTRRQRPAASQDHPLTLALQAVGRHEGITIRSPAASLGREPTLDDIVRTSGVRARRVRLSAEDRWWLGDSGAMLAHLRENGRPVALLPGAKGRYRVLDPVSGQSKHAGPQTSKALGEQAWLLYRSLPNDRPVGLQDLMAVAGGNVAGDLARLAAAGLGAGVLTLAPAVAVNLLVGSVIPAGDLSTLVQLSAVLGGLALVAALFHVLRGTALMRLEGRVTARISAALWDRLLRLQPAFFRGYTAGELAHRAAAFELLRDQVSGAVADALLSALFLLPTFALLFYYDTVLGWLNLGFGLAMLTVMSVAVALHVAPQRRYLEMMRLLAGELFQFINGIGKLRATGTEGSAFATWARRYREQKQAQIRVSVLNEHVTAFSAAVPALASAALFALALRQGPDGLEPAVFLAVYTASMLFYMAVVRLGQSLQPIASIVPVCEQALPIVHARTDSAPAGGAQVTLQGEIALHRVSFRYAGNGPMVLRDVSIHAGPGELIAIVGESGSGKSTLFRIALGLEQPSSGAVYYDGRDLAHLDLDAVRRQVGTVTQDGALQGGNVLNNIIGVSQDLTVDDAWRAARRAAVDRDIAAMPMSMYTVVGENASTFSGGQNQRIRIAAALVRSPRILLLDEPTSWLDTKSQAETMEGIEQSVSTRIVIAHRLSTIRRANRIYVLQAGRVAQVGQFDELLAQDGPFRDLARRQLMEPSGAGEPAARRTARQSTGP